MDSRWSGLERSTEVLRGGGEACGERALGEVRLGVDELEDSELDDVLRWALGRTQPVDDIVMEGALLDRSCSRLLGSDAFVDFRRWPWVRFSGCGDVGTKARVV